MDSPQNNYTVFAVFHNGDAILHKDFILLPERYIQVGDNEPAPIEDYGDWMLFEDEGITKDEAFDKLMEKIETRNNNENIQIYTEIIKVSISKLKEIWNPFTSRIWKEMETPITTEEIKQAIVENKLISPEEIKNMLSGFWNEMTREQHVQRVAWLALNFNEDYPVDIDFGIPGMISFAFVDGNHRLAAAIYIEKEYINCRWSGAESAALEFIHS